MEKPSYEMFFELWDVWTIELNICELNEKKWDFFVSQSYSFPFLRQKNGNNWRPISPEERNTNYIRNAVLMKTRKNDSDSNLQTQEKVKLTSYFLHSFCCGNLDEVCVNSKFVWNKSIGFWVAKGVLDRRDTVQISDIKFQVRQRV